MDGGGDPSNSGMNPFFLLLALAVFAAAFSGVLMAVLIGKEMAVPVKGIRRRISAGLEPLADAVRLERSARRLNRAVLEFEAA